MQICFTSYSGIRSHFCTPYTCLVLQMAPDNMPPHDRHLMGHSEFLHGSIRKTAGQERQRLITFIFVDMIQYPYILKNSIYHLSKQGSPPFFDKDTSLVLGNFLVYSFKKTLCSRCNSRINLGFVLEYTFLQLCLNAKQISQVQRIQKKLHRSVAVQTNHFKLTLLFLLDVSCSKWPHSWFVFFRLFVPNDG